MGEGCTGVLAGSLAVANVTVILSSQQYRIGRLHGRLAGLLAGMAICLLARPAAAYRPFDGTDAAVTDEGEVEIEFQPVHDYALVNAIEVTQE